MITEEIEINFYALEKHFPSLGVQDAIIISYINTQFNNKENKGITENNEVYYKITAKSISKALPILGKFRNGRKVLMCTKQVKSYIKKLIDENIIKIDKIMY